jgi:hypothetical protein
MPPETPPFSPELQTALTAIREAGWQDLFLLPAVASRIYLKDGLGLIDWLRLRFGETPTIITGLEPREDNSNQDYLDLAQACGEGGAGVNNLARLIQTMQAAGMFREGSALPQVLPQIAAMLVFPEADQRDKALRDCLAGIIENEGRAGSFSLKDLTARAVDIMAWLKSRPGSDTDLLAAYNQAVSGGGITPGQQIKIELPEEEPVKPAIQVIPDLPSW